MSIPRWIDSQRDIGLGGVGELDQRRCVVVERLLLKKKKECDGEEEEGGTREGV
jgi:hypothetical protein